MDLERLAVEILNTETAKDTESRVVPTNLKARILAALQEVAAGRRETFAAFCQVCPN